jgi:hypothetical protein
MNILRNLPVRALLCVVGMLSIPAGRAAENDRLRKEVAHLTNLLVNLPAERSAPARVHQLVLKLSRLAPQYANGYFRWGISKLPYRGYNGNQDRLASQAIAIVKGAGLKSPLKAKIIARIREAVNLAKVPPPYQS